jgi:hypothetical protein
MEAILAALFPPELPVMDEKEVITGHHIHKPFEHVPEDGIGARRLRKFRDGIERVELEMLIEDAT